MTTALLLYTIFGLAALASGVVTFSLAMMISPPHDGPDAPRYCGGCGYNLTRISQPRCPECGSPLGDVGVRNIPPEQARLIALVHALTWLTAICLGMLCSVPFIMESLRRSESTFRLINTLLMAPVFIVGFWWVLDQILSAVSHKRIV